MSLTGYLGCQYGGAKGVDGIGCFNARKGPKDSFAGWMVYNRFWFDKDKYAATLGGGQMDNPGRYLTLLPPINQATAVTGTPYFTENPGNIAKMWDTTITLQWMPRTWACPQKAERIQSRISDARRRLYRTKPTYQPVTTTSPARITSSTVPKVPTTTMRCRWNRS